MLLKKKYIVFHRCFVQIYYTYFNHYDRQNNNCEKKYFFRVFLILTFEPLQFGILYENNDFLSIIYAKYIITLSDNFYNIQHVPHSFLSQLTHYNFLLSHLSEIIIVVSYALPFYKPTQSINLYWFQICEIHFVYKNEFAHRNFFMDVFIFKYVPSILFFIFISWL